jgi:hypothetical protein
VSVVVVALERALPKLWRPGLAASPGSEEDSRSMGKGLKLVNVALLLWGGELLGGLGGCSTSSVEVGVDPLGGREGRERRCGP